MHLSNGLAAECFNQQWHIGLKHSIDPTGYTDTHYVHWHILMRCADHLYHRFIAAWTVTASQTLRSPGQPKRTKTEWGLTNSQTKPSKPMLQSNMMMDIQNQQSTQFTLWQQVPHVGCDGWIHATKNKNNSSSIFNIQIHTDKLLSKNIFMTFFLTL